MASSRFLQSRYWAREVWHFVPDDLPLREMSICWPSGTTGSEAAMKVTLHPL